MGGDKAPRMVVEGVDMAIRDLPGVEFLLFGDEKQLGPLLAEFPNAKAVCRIRHTDEMVANEESAGYALRSGRNSSMRLAINAVKDGEAAGVVSAGNTGALMAMAKFVLKTLPGISRPAIAAVIPTMRGESIMLDLGANVECGIDNLVQFAVMGEVYARNVLGLKQPTIGILNIGEEDMKGNEAVKGAAAILQEINLPIKFFGFIEGDDIAAGTVDVIVTDGFTGNVALKTAEGMVKMMAHFMKDALMASPMSRMGALLARPALKRLQRRFDPRLHNGAIFLGLDGICVKSHGGTDGLGFASAVKVAVDLITDNLNEGIKEDFACLETDRHGIQGAATSG